jgi:hypothetical protein
MGQQQLLLLVLSAIIVGTSIVVGINMFGASAYSANRESVIEDAATIGARAQEWYRKPTVLGGGGRTFDLLTDVRLHLGFPDSTANGTYTIAGSGQSATITAIGQEDGNNDGTNLTVLVTVTPDAISVPNITND